MSLEMAFDLFLAASLLWSGWRALSAPDLDCALTLFITFGLLMVLAWARLTAPDIALAEAAIGAGLTGALLLDAYGVLRAGKVGGQAGKFTRLTVVLAAVSLVLILIPALADLAPPALDMRPLVEANLQDSGVTHPVTAVLLNYRGYDTLLEVGVLLLALVALLAARGTESGMVSVPRPSPDPLLAMLGRVAVPVMVVVAVYLLWAGAFRPGGAFQAAAVLAAAAVLLHLTGLRPGWRQPGAGLRWGLAGGFFLFLGVGVILLLVEGELLRFPPDYAGLLILLVESGLTLSLGLILAGLFLFLSHDNRGA